MAETTAQNSGYLVAVVAVVVVLVVVVVAAEVEVETETELEAGFEVVVMAADAAVLIVAVALEDSVPVIVAAVDVAAVPALIADVLADLIFRYLVVGPGPAMLSAQPARLWQQDQHGQHHVQMEAPVALVKRQETGFRGGHPVILALLQEKCLVALYFAVYSMDER